MSPKKPLPKPGPFASLQKPRNKVIFIAVFTILHIGLTALLLFWNFNVLSSYNSSGTLRPTAGRLLGSLSEVSQWPLISILSRNESMISSLPAYSFYVAMFLNSLLWAIVILGLLLVIRRLTRSRSRSRK